MMWPFMRGYEGLGGLGGLSCLSLMIYFYNFYLKKFEICISLALYLERKNIYPMSYELSG